MIGTFAIVLAALPCSWLGVPALSVRLLALRPELTPEYAPVLKRRAMHLAALLMFVPVACMATSVFPTLPCILIIAASFLMGAVVCCDCCCRIIPSELSASLLVLGLLYRTSSPSEHISWMLLMLACLLPLSLAALNMLLVRSGGDEALGGGDIRLLPALCLFSGLGGFASGVMACALSMGVLAARELVRPREQRTQHLPLAPGLYLWFLVGVFSAA